MAHWLTVPRALPEDQGSSCQHSQLPLTPVPEVLVPFCGFHQLSLTHSTHRQVDMYTYTYMLKVQLLGNMICPYKPSTRGAEASGSLSLRPACFIYEILGYPGIHHRPFQEGNK